LQSSAAFSFGMPAVILLAMPEQMVVIAAPSELTF
jgi:hypothetical protein